MASTSMRQVIRAPRERVFAALLDPDAVARWRVPANMTSEVHEWDAREGGSVRVSLTYNERDAAGKTSGHTDTYRGRFTRIVPNELVVEVDEFETDDPAVQGEMTMRFRLRDVVDGHTEVVAEHEGLPDGVSVEDNETGFREALARLAALLET